jgi:protein-tyrosine phosphatase
MDALRDAGIDILVSLLTGEEGQELGLYDEAKHALSRGLGFISFPIADRAVPASAIAVDQLVEELKKKLGAGEAIGIHCRACIGRSALVAACLLVEQGATPAQAFERISRARGCNVPDTNEQVAWVESFAGRISRQ